MTFQVFSESRARLAKNRHNELDQGRSAFLKLLHLKLLLPVVR